MDILSIYKILGILTTAYPRYYQGLSEQSFEDTVALWLEMLSDIDEGLCLVAVKKSIATSVYPPTIAEVRKACVYIQQPNGVDAGEAWGEVVQAIRQFGYMRQVDAVESLSPLTRKVVQCMGWSEICKSENPMVDRAHFLKLYDSVRQADQEYYQVPKSIRLAMEQTRFFDEGNKPIFSMSEERGKIGAQRAGAVF